MIHETNEQTHIYCMISTLFLLLKIKKKEKSMMFDFSFSLLSARYVPGDVCVPLP